jgi:outer membrane protein assembly factor BamB
MNCSKILGSILVLCLLNTTRGQDWKMWGGSPSRNNSAVGKNIPDDWEIGKLDRETQKFAKLRNIKWYARLGSQSYGNPIIADGHVYVGSNNGAGHLKRFPAQEDVSCLICFRESDGKFLWQHSNMKLAPGRVHDWPMQGICSTPVVEDDRLWYISNRGEVVCLDTKGFYDNQDDGQVKDEWVRIFRVDRFIEKTLYRWRIHSGLRQAFAKANVELPRGAFLNFRPKAGEPWQIIRYDRSQSYPNGRKPIFELERRGDQVVAFKLSDADPSVRTKELFATANDLYPGLAKNELTEKLRAEFLKHGYEVPKQARLTEIELNKKWKFKAVTRGIEREFELTETDSVLTCRSIITKADKDEADVVWRFDMMKTLGTRQHNMSNCSPAIFGNLLFVCTSNGVDQTHQDIPAPEAPSFMALNKKTGKVLWTDASPGQNILHGQWSSPSIGEFDGVPQVIFPAGDGWVYSFRADKWDKEKKQPIPLWKFDANPKTSKWILGGRGTRNNVISMPVIYDGRVYIASGQEPEHGEGDGHLWCIDPTKRGDISAELAVKIRKNKRIPIPPRRMQAVNEELNERANPNSAVIWHWDHVDRNMDGQRDLQEGMHRTISTPAIKNDLMFIPDFTGLVHCLDAKTGRVHWTYDLFAACWGSPLIVDDKVYVGDEDGDVTIFQLSADPKRSFKGPPDKDFPHFFDEARQEIVMPNTVYTTPVVANGTLFITTRSHLFAIEKPSN